MYDIIIDDFEGPLDLLLHLIKESKMDIFNISIVDITNEYLEYINKMEEMNLTIASSYLVMASELIEMKSRMLLPVHKSNDEDEYETDPKEELINRLIEYQKYKDMTKSFKELEELRNEIYTKSPESLKEYMDDTVNLSNDISLDDLVSAIEKFVARKKEEMPLSTKVTRREITVAERKRDIQNILKKKRKVRFLELFEEVTKEYIVVTFLTILEMAKEQNLVITQENNFDEIYCEALYE